MNTIEKDSDVLGGEDNNTNARLIASLEATRQKNKTEPMTETDQESETGQESETDQEIQKPIADYGKEVLGGIDSLIVSTETLTGLQDNLQKSIKKMTGQVMGKYNEKVEDGTDKEIDLKALETHNLVVQAFRNSKKEIDKIEKKISNKSSEEGNYQEYKSTLETDFLALEQAKSSQDKAIILNGISEKLAGLKIKTDVNYNDIDQKITNLELEIQRHSQDFIDDLTTANRHEPTRHELATVANALTLGVNEVIKVLSEIKREYFKKAEDNDNRIAMMQNDGARLAEEIAKK
jgi:hypothetical protein